MSIKCLIFSQEFRLSDDPAVPGTHGPVVIPHVLRVAVPELHVPHDLQLDTKHLVSIHNAWLWYWPGDLHWLLEQDPGHWLVQGRGGQRALICPVALTGREEACGVQGLLNTGAYWSLVTIPSSDWLLTFRASVSPFLGMSWRTSHSFPNSGCSFPTFKSQFRRIIWEDRET